MHQFGIFASILLLVIVVTASFAYFGSFNVNLINNVAVNVNAFSPGNAIFTSNATQLNLQVPAANMSQLLNGTLAAENKATLKTELNGAYLTALLGTSNINGKLSSAIANAKWHLGGASSSNYTTLTAEVYIHRKEIQVQYVVVIQQVYMQRLG